MKILVVEDDAVDEQRLHRFLDDEHEVTTTRTGKHALELIEDASLDCVILDNRLPDFEGLELLPRFRERQLPVIMLTGQGSEATAVEAMRRGSIDYLNKETLTPGILKDSLEQARRMADIDRQAEERTRQEHLRLLAVAQHLHTSVSKIPACCWSIQQKMEAAMVPQARREFEFIEQTAHRIEDGLKGIANQARHGPHQIAREAVDLEQLLQDVLNTLYVPIRLNRAEVAADPLPEVEGDPFSLFVIFETLIDNALKHRGLSAPKIHISDFVNDRHWHLLVTDNGPGIDPSRQESVFQEHDNPDAGASPTPGLGLPLCRRLISLHGGNIWIESTPGRGAIFHFTIQRTSGGRTAESRRSQ